jgi:two-component system, OmpR family, manganese sensing sensor histidine kinase
MFQPIRQRLLLSYLLFMGTVLAGFAIAVRLLFVHSLNQQLHEKLMTLGELSASSLEWQNGQMTLENDFPTSSLQSHEQALEWFDPQGKPIGHQGRNYLTLPFGGAGASQMQAGNPRIRGVTLPVMGREHGQLMGYVRVSQSLEEFDESIRHLDWVLGSGTGIGLVVIGAGGVWLTWQAMQPIERSFRQLQQFTADASHELRSPLMAIQTNAQVALKYPEGIRPGDAAKFGAIVSATTQLSHLTEDLLFLARTDMSPPLDMVRLNLTELLTHLVEFYQPQAAVKSIVLKRDLDEDDWLTGNSGQLRRLFTNLLDNALRHTPESGQITISRQVTELHLRIAIADSGIGIAPENLTKVFDRFWQADAARSESSGSAGLGGERGGGSGDGQRDHQSPCGGDYGFQCDWRR